MDAPSRSPRPIDLLVFLELQIYALGLCGFGWGAGDGALHLCGDGEWGRLVAGGVVELWTGPIGVIPNWPLSPSVPLSAAVTAHPRGGGGETSPLRALTCLGPRCSIAN